MQSLGLTVGQFAHKFVTLVDIKIIQTAEVHFNLRTKEEAERLGPASYLVSPVTLEFFYESTRYAPSRFLFRRDLSVPWNILLGRRGEVSASLGQARLPKIHLFSRERITNASERIKILYDCKANEYIFSDGDKAMDKGQIVTDYFCAVYFFTTKFRDSLINKQSGMITKGVRLFADDAFVHSSRNAVD
ncbi:hypothetical protein TNCV_3758901 [Trichonephila clavipes]|nr:hypothetical protein TNCV_3758901 [Trichonephila clavipes]